MAAINRTELLEDVKMYMRSDNVFTDAQMNKMVDYVISVVGDNDDNYEEVLCKSLRSIAVNNKAKSSDVGQQKSIRTEDLEEEFFKGNNNSSWDSYLDSLDDVCASFGYTELEAYTTGFMYINPGGSTSTLDDPPIDVNPTSITSVYLGSL